MKKMIICLIAILVSCSGGIKEGEIFSKEFTPAHTAILLMPVVVSNGKTCTTTMVPMCFYYPDSYSVAIKNYNREAKKKDTRIVYIEKQVYDKVNIGQWYCIAENDGDEPVRIKQARQEAER